MIGIFKGTNIKVIAYLSLAKSTSLHGVEYLGNKRAIASLQIADDMMIFAKANE